MFELQIDQPTKMCITAIVSFFVMIPDAMLVNLPELDPTAEVLFRRMYTLSWC